MGNIIDRALDIINDHLKDQTSSFPDPITVRPMARGGEVLSDEFPSHYMPRVGRQVMADGGDPVEGALNTARAIGDDQPAIPAPAAPKPPVSLFEGRVSAAPKQSVMTRRGQVLHPRTPDPSPEEIAAAKADTRSGGDIVNKRLDVIVPESSRVVGGTYTPGSPTGGRWADMGSDFLKQPGLGFKFTQDQRDAEKDLEQAHTSGDENSISNAQKRLDDAHAEGDKILHKLWNESVNESSAAAKAAVEKHKVKPLFMAKDWDKAMRLPLQDHLWYELSGEKMGENMPDLSHDEFMKLMDLIGATSARAKPLENAERALGVMSQHMRGVPADVDITIPETVRQALGRDHRESSALPGNKTGHFSDTLALTGGVPTRFPISVNDVWVGKMFGVPDDVMSSNQSLHEPMAIYFNKIRDLYNENHPEKPFTYQSWNFQAPAWVHLRGEEAKEESGDAYHQVWGSIVNKLKKAGVTGIDGEKLNRAAFMDPDFADALRRTTGAFRTSPKATIEFGTKLTDIGAQAHALYDEAVQRGDTLSQSQYLKGLVTAMYQSARGTHPWDSLKKALTGNLSTDITRISHPKSSAPLDTGGTFEAAVSPNIRVPLKDMDDDQLEAFNAIVGKHLHQKAMAISTVLPAQENSAPKAGHIRGYSLFVPTTDQMHPDDIHKLATSVFSHGHDLSYDRYPNGYRFDVIPRYEDDGSSFGIDRDKLEDAAIDSLGDNYKGIKVLPHDFRSVYTPDTDYDRIRNDSIERIKDDFIKQAVAAGIKQSDARKALKSPKVGDALSGRGKKAWNNYRARIDHLSDAEKGFQALAQRVEDSHRDFINSATKRFAKPAKAYGGAISPFELANNDLEDEARRLILWSYAASPIMRPLSRAEGGTVDDPINKALDIVGTKSSPSAAIDTARNLTPMGFYSAAAEAANKIPQRAPIDQIINKIKGQPNVKQAELDNANLADTFAGQKSVDPKEVARHLQTSVPQLSEKVYGGKLEKEYKPYGFDEYEDFPKADMVYEVGPDRDIKNTWRISYYPNNNRNKREYNVYDPSGTYHESFNNLEDATLYANQGINRVDPTNYHEYTIPGGKDYREVVMTLPGENKYTHDHWTGVSNPVAHLRMSDRDNGKTLHVEELQSDWGQEGRKVGFGEGKIPEAPYVTDTNQWVDLGLKRALMEAAKGGYDKLVWTPGEAQADRYNLSKKLNAIHWSPDSNVLKAVDHDYNIVINQKVDKDKLPNFIGKELAEKLMATKALPNVHRFEGETAHSLIGGDLKVGSHKMQSFYDKLVPQRLNKLISQYDPSAKVQMHSYPLSYQRGTGQQGDVDWEGNPVEEMETKKVMGHVLHITPKMRSAILNGLPAFKSGGDVSGRPVIDAAFKVLSKLPK